MNARIALTQQAKFIEREIRNGEHHRGEDKIFDMR